MLGVHALEVAVDGGHARAGLTHDGDGAIGVEPPMGTAGPKIDGLDVIGYPSPLRWLAPVLDIEKSRRRLAAILWHHEESATQL